jgi:hypothetical protein
MALYCVAQGPGKLVGSRISNVPRLSHRKIERQQRDMKDEDRCHPAEITIAYEGRVTGDGYRP